ncbi:MAG: LysM peptidoglycan-binding domain-containing protein, partial [Candidatus Omnitrophota bacterium]|nr:LysM peptidoglycan-binding domain-containing protein [Candidatus Omnitrophota bacterium]
MKNRFILLILLSMFLAGCATVPSPRPVARKIGIYHPVKKGETLSRIAKIYHLSAEEIARVNRLSDKNKIDIGQLLFIPGVYPYKKSSTGRLQPSFFKTARIENRFIWPLKNKICSFFGSVKNGIKNKGVDIKAEEGTAIVAAKSGIV